MNTTSPTAGAKCSADLSALFRARNALIWCVTREEARAERIIFNAAAAANYAPVFWDCASGLGDISGNTDDASLADPVQVLAAIRDSDSRQVWILRDLPPWLRDPTVTRALRSLCRTLPQSPRDNARAVVVLSPSADVPPELQGHATVIDIPLPDRAEVAALLDASIAALPEELRAGAAANGTRDAAIDAAIGLTAEEAQSTFARSLILSRTIDPLTVSGEKRRVIARERILEWFDPLPAGLDGIAGLEYVKNWCVERAAAFTPAARAYGLPAPRGLLAVGVPGCGKSLLAKALGTAWKMPLLRFDAGALRSKFVGESEAKVRKAFSVAEAVAPCLLWIDEIEKALAGATQGAADGGVSADALGVLLTWMQERTAPVFVIATANDVGKLPPELLNRFDETFFVDLPTTAERAGIVSVALRQFNPPGADSIDAAAVAAVSADFTGRELARLVPDAMFSAFSDGKRPINTADLIESARKVVPLARSATERITAVRQWAQGRARPASVPETVTKTSGARALDI